MQMEGFKLSEQRVLPFTKCINIKTEGDEAAEAGIFRTEWEEEHCCKAEGTDCVPVSCAAQAKAESGAELQHKPELLSSISIKTESDTWDGIRSEHGDAHPCDEIEIKIDKKTLPEKRPYLQQAVGGAEVSAMLKCGKYSLQKNYSKSEVWRLFGLIYNEKNEHLPFVACFKCRKCYTYQGRASGTSHLKRHRCKVTSGQYMIPHMLVTSNGLSVADQQKIHMACVNFVCQDIRPCSVVSGQGFHGLVQTLLNIQARHKDVLQAKDVLPHRTTVATMVNKEGDRVRQVLGIELTSVMERKRHIAFTTDLWTDEHRKVSYLTISGHWLDQGWNLHSRVLATEDLEVSQKKSGEKIRAAIATCLKSLGVTITNNIIFTTDKGSNILSALCDTTDRLDCTAHVLNGVLTNTFSETNCPEEVTHLLTGVKGIVRYLHKSGLSSLLTKAVEQCTETRWISRYMMLKSFRVMLDEITLVFNYHAPTELHRLDGIDKSSVDELVSFLEPFRTATDELEASHRPTLHRVLPLMERLKIHCRKKSNKDSSPIKAVKSTALAILQERFKPHLLHKVAVFLNPRQKSMKALDDSSKCEVKKHILSRLMAIEKEEPTTEIAGPLPKRCRLRLEDDLFDDDDEDDEDDCFVRPKYIQEMTNYESAKICTDLELLQWWKVNEGKYPRLAAVARSIFCVMATSAASERSFSVAGQIVSSRRTHLNPEAVENVLLVNSSLKW